MSDVNADTAAQVAEREPKKYPLLLDLFIRLVREKPLGTVGGIIVLILALVAIFANVIAAYGANESHLADRLVGPSIKYLLGTDNLGRDLFTRIIFGARISIFVGLGGAALSTGVAVIIGLISGFVGGKTDMTIQRFVDAWFCFPSLFIYLTVMSILGPGLVQVILVLGIHSGIHQSRVIRGAVIGIKENMYVEAARAIGAPTTSILWRHILPNVLAPIITIFAVRTGYMILSEATLSFLGFGIPPPEPSWGGMLSGDARKYMSIAPWLAVWPGVALAVTVYGLNMLGDAVRDLLDPRLRGGLGRYGSAKKKGPR
jgi:peptide/nickel transport system permease protein